jgi:hypothetical protein
MSSAGVPASWGHENPPRVWSWRPPHAAWFGALQVKIERWRPTTRLALRSDTFLSRIVEGCSREEDWLVHPSVNAVMSPSPLHRTERDLAFVAWAARHVEADGVLEVDAPHIIWTVNGGARLEPGRYTLRAIASDDSEPREVTAPNGALEAIGIDPWCSSGGVPIADSWADLVPANDAEINELAAVIRRYCVMLATFKRLLPECFEWVVSVTRVAVPLRQRGTTLHSHSVEDFPGLVALDIPVDLIAFVELLVHESAHHHLFMADASAPLVKPHHEGRYRSPLRPDPRPLRGVLLAYHALAYICAAFRELKLKVRGDDTQRHDYERLRSQLGDAGNVVAEAHAFLTGEGEAFVLHTNGVAAYGACRD